MLHALWRYGVAAVDESDSCDYGNLCLSGVWSEAKPSRASMQEATLHNASLYITLARGSKSCDDVEALNLDIYSMMSWILKFGSRWSLVTRASWNEYVDPKLYFANARDQVNAM
jgi:hypothetical protein